MAKNEVQEQPRSLAAQAAAEADQSEVPFFAPVAIERDEGGDEEGRSLITQAAAQAGDPADLAPAAFADHTTDGTLVGGEEEIAEATVAELRKRAAQLDIEGRSSMTKDELVAAIAEAEQG